MVGETQRWGSRQMSAKHEILRRIRSCLESSRPDRDSDYAAIPRAYRHASQLDLGSRVDLFEQRLREYGAAVYRCRTDSIQETIAYVLAARNKAQLVNAAAVPAHWLPSSPYSFTPDKGLTYEELDASEGVLTSCTLAIALTGTIIMRHTPSEGRRALGLIPDYHLCIVAAAQVVETVPEAIRNIENPGLVTTISGPSATADIEMTRIKGVHGPRSLDVVIVSDS